MPQLVWFNSPTNHSGTVNFLFLDADGEVKDFSLDTSDGGGPYILGGPALGDGSNLTKSALKLVSLMPAGFHFFPEGIVEDIREAIVENRDEIKDDCSRLNGDDWNLRVFSDNYKTVKCCDLLLADQQPKSAIVFVDLDQDGDLLLAMELTKIYHKLPKKRRDNLGLKSDWQHHLDLEF